MEEEFTDYETRNAVEIEPGVIDCEILHPVKGWLPHTCTATDTDPAGKARHEIMVARKSFRQMTATEKSGRGEAKREQAATIIRMGRTTLLAASDYIVAVDVWPSLTPEKQAEWVAYRRDLRDITEQPSFPNKVTWPVKPA
jgi:hypothetical protein